MYYWYLENFQQWPLQHNEIKNTSTARYANTKLNNNLIKNTSVALLSKENTNVALLTKENTSAARYANTSATHYNNTKLNNNLIKNSNEININKMNDETNINEMNDKIINCNISINHINWCEFCQLQIDFSKIFLLKFNLILTKIIIFIKSSFANSDNTNIINLIIIFIMIYILVLIIKKK